MTKKSEKKVRLRINYGFDGRSMSIVGPSEHGARIAGEKPWNGGYPLEEWELSSRELIKRIQNQKVHGQVIFRTGKIQNSWTFSIGDEELGGDPRDVFQCPASLVIKSINEYKYL